MGRKMTKAEIAERLESALQNGHIYVCFQAQINHATERMIGAEALVRWNDPECGPQSPMDFIPVLEENGRIIQVDLFVFEEVCRFQKKCMDSRILPFPISVNMSRYDITNEEAYIGEIERIRNSYGVPVKYIRIEITESFADSGVDKIVSVLDRLHQLGYIVEMDDFGSGYSSLGILKDLDVDIIKLDMGFFNGEIDGRGGTIISSIAQMAKWLDTPIIAEGVETMEQADYMRSLGCYYIQGYLYARPSKQEDFLQFIRKEEFESEKTTDFEDFDAGKLGSLGTVESLLFHKFAGPAAILLYDAEASGRLEILRVNQKYVKELGMNLTEKEILHADPWSAQDAENRRVYEDAIRRAIETKEEVSCDSWRCLHSDCCGDERICIRSYIQAVGRADNQYILYVSIRNVTTEMLLLQQVEDSEKKFRVASEHNNSFAWEYMISTKEMRPCSRCMRELGLPPLVENYPEPVIASGLIPPDYADMYRDLMDQLARGARSLDAVIPLTADRVPFRFQYTAEFDESGRPFKAYGSATQVV